MPGTGIGDPDFDAVCAARGCRRRRSRARRAACSAARSPRGWSAPRGSAADRSRSARFLGRIRLHPQRDARRSPPAPKAMTTTSCASATMSVGSFERASAPLSAVESVRRSSTSLPRTRVSSSRPCNRSSSLRVDAVEEPLEFALHDRQRRAQLVRDVGHQLPPRLVLRRRAPGHRVERARRVTDPRGSEPGLADPHVVVAVRDPVGG